MKCVLKQEEWKQRYAALAVTTYVTVNCCFLILFQLLQLCGHVLACVQAPVSEQTITPGAATQAITQFADGYRKSEERLASVEQTLEEV